MLNDHLKHNIHLRHLNYQFLQAGIFLEAIVYHLPKCKSTIVIKSVKVLVSYGRSKELLSMLLSSSKLATLDTMYVDFLPAPPGTKVSSYGFSLLLFTLISRWSSASLSSANPEILNNLVGECLLLCKVLEL